MSNDTDGKKELIELPHHRQYELCRTRAAYRQGRKLKAVKTYSICSESTHLLIFGVPKINLAKELETALRRYGSVSVNVKDNYPTEEFTECFHAKFKLLQSARVAKKRMDATTFYGSCLHICYAPELETIEDTRSKLSQRKTYVLRHLASLEKEKLKQTQKIQNSIEYRNPRRVRLFESDPSIEETITDNVEYIQQFPPNVSKVEEKTTEPIPNTSQNGSGSTEIPQNKINTSKRPTESPDGNVYVFPRKKKRRKNKIKNKNDFFNLSPENNTVDLSEIPASGGSVTVYDKLDEPKVVKLPPKAVNKIIMENDTKLI